MSLLDGMTDGATGDAAGQMAPAASDALRVRQLAAELHGERCLSRLGQQLNACITASLAAAASQTDALETASCHTNVQLSQILVNLLSTALVEDDVAVLQGVNDAGDRAGTDEQVSGRSFTVCAIASEHAKASPSDPFLAASEPVSVVLGQILTDRDIDRWQAQCPNRLWQIRDDQRLLGWLVLTPRHTPQSELLTGGSNACLKARLVEQSLAQYVTALGQVELIQTQAQQRRSLTDSNRELTQTNQLKSEFLANTSHEIRTPLSSILGFTHLMREQGFSPNNLRHQEYLNIILTSGQHLLALINDILDLSKIEANQLDLQWETVTVKAVCQTAMTLVREKANDKGLTLKLEIAPEAETLVADGLRLKQMLFNLLSNALKFTSHGSVGLQVTAVSDRLRFTVWDTGTGISENQQQLLFRPYSQIANAAVKRDEGTGLGLALTQKLAELHGGRVEVSSTLGQGSRFTIVLPLVPQSSANGGIQSLEPIHSLPAERAIAQSPIGAVTDSVSAEATAPAASAVSIFERTTKPRSRSNHLLLVEDNLYNAKLMLTYLSKLGYELTWVKNGAEMRQALERSLPALILMDIHLPGEDGFALTQELKADDRYRAIPIIAQTAMAMTGDRDLCIEAGIEDYISKPINLIALAQLIGQYVMA